MPTPAARSRDNERARTITINLAGCLPDAPSRNSLPVRVSQDALQMFRDDPDIRYAVDRMYRVSRLTTSLDYDKINVIVSEQYFADTETVGRIKASAVSAVVTAMRAQRRAS